MNDKKNHRASCADVFEKITKEAIRFQVNINNGIIMPALQVRTLHLIPETMTSNNPPENIGRMEQVLLMQPSMSGDGQVLFIDRAAVKNLADALLQIWNEYAGEGA